MPDVNGLPYPALSDPNNPPADFLALATAVDGKLTTLNGKFPVSVANGGTGATTVADARKNLAIGWHEIGDALVDNLVGTEQILTTTYGDVTGTSFTVTTTGKPARITVKTIYENGSSGGTRFVSHRLMQDGVLIGKQVEQIPVTYVTTRDRIYSEYTHKFTPTAGSHTYKLQALASINSAVLISYAYVTLEEYEA